MEGCVPTSPTALQGPCHAIEERDCTRKTFAANGDSSGEHRTLGLGMNHVAALRAADGKLTTPSGGSAKSVIFIFLSGGLAQHDSFDPKPDAPADIRGEFPPIATRTPGVRDLRAPAAARRAQPDVGAGPLADAPVQRALAGHMAMLTGRTPMPPGFNASKPQPSDWPSIAVGRRGRRPAAQQQPAAGRRAARAARSTTRAASFPVSSAA